MSQNEFELKGNDVDDDDDDDVSCAAAINPTDTNWCPQFDSWIDVRRQLVEGE